jgi:hypothetical protein
MTMRAPNHVVAVDEPPPRVLVDAYAAFHSARTSCLLPVVSRFEAALWTAAADAGEIGDVVVFNDDEVVVFVWSRRTPGGSRLVAQVFGCAATANAALWRAGTQLSTPLSLRNGRFESATVPTGPACLVIDARVGTHAKRWHTEWQTL